MRLRIAIQLAPMAVFLFCLTLSSQGQEHPPLRTAESTNPTEGTFQVGRGDNNRGAQLYQEGRYIEAAAAYRMECDHFNARACTDLGVMYRRGQGVRKDYHRAADLSLRGCDGGNAVGCTNLGLMYWNNVMPKNDERAAELFARGCDGGDNNGCRALGFMYENGQGVPKDQSRAALLYQMGSGQHRIPFKVQEGMIVIETKISGEIVKLLVDTGGTTALAMKFLPPERRLDSPTRTLELVHGSMDVYPVSLTWSLDGKDKKMSAIIGDFHLPEGTDGVFGADILETFRSARFDFSDSVLVLEDK